MSIWKDSRVELPDEKTVIIGITKSEIVEFDEYIKNINVFRSGFGYWECEDISKWCLKEDLIKQAEEK